MVEGPQGVGKKVSLSHCLSRTAVALEHLMFQNKKHLPLELEDGVKPKTRVCKGDGFSVG